MKKYLLFPLLLTLISCAPKAKISVAEHQCPKPVEVSSGQFDKLKTLVGTWQGKHKGEKGMEDVKVEYQLTSGGSTLVEKLFPGTPHEMVSIYTPTKTATGSTVTMTHYCMLGNQPRMQLKTSDAKTMFFDFVDGANIASSKDAHMHSLKIKLTDHKHLTQEWSFYNAGKKIKTEVFHFVRT